MWVKGGRGPQADGTAGLPPAPEIPTRSGTYASCQKRKSGAGLRRIGGQASHANVLANAQQMEELGFAKKKDDA
jgi:hypothetical protein